MFVNGIDLKEDLTKLVAHYSALPENVLKSGLNHFAGYPPEDPTFLTTQLWDKYLPGWRTSKQRPQTEHDPESEKKLVEELNQMTDSPELTAHDERDIDKLSYVTIRKVCVRAKGSGCGFPRNKSSGCGTVEKYLSPSARLCSVCLLSTMLDSKPSICSLGFSIFSTTWGVCFSLKANPNGTNE